MTPSGLRLGIVYHMPFWQTPDGTLWEQEGSFARYVDSLAPYVAEIRLAVPVFTQPPTSGTRVRAGNVTLAPLPFFPGPRQFYPRLAAIYPRLRRFVASCDVLHLRVPSPAALMAFRLARKMKRPVFALIVGDYRALAPQLKYRGIKKLLFSLYVAHEERAVSLIARQSLTFVNGAALREKHRTDNPGVVETKTSTLRQGDISARIDTCQGRPVRLLTVSRIDPRKNLRVLPAAVALLQQAGVEVTLDIVGPPIGLIGEQERRAIAADAEARGVGDRVRLRGSVPLDDLMAVYGSFDLFVLPTGPGEGVPRVLLEAMANGLPVITTDVAGISSLIDDGRNGILLAEGTGSSIAAAVRRLVDAPTFRQRLISAGYDTARAHTVDVQAATMMAVVARELGLPLARVPQVA